MRNLYFLAFLLFTIIDYSKAQSEFTYKITFVNKGLDIDWFDIAQKNISQKALERRYKQNIILDSTDIPVNTTYINLIHNQTQAKCLFSSKWFNSSTFITSDSTEFLKTVQQFEFIKDIKLTGYFPDGYFTQVKNKNSKIKETFEDIQFKSSIDYAQAFDQLNMHNGFALHQMGYTGKAIDIAIFDGGFRSANTMQVFKKLFAENRFKGEKNFVYSGSSVFNYSNHGTYVLSCISSDSTGLFIGSAPQSNIYLCATENNNSEQIIEMDYWIAAAEWADSIGVDIISSSLGYNTFDNSQDDFSLSQLDGKTALISKAATMAARKGIFVVNSAGNEGENSWGKILFPADADSILTVGGVTPTGEYVKYSGRGNTADGRIKPEVCATGFPVFVIGENGKVIPQGGTSFSAPIISGLVACLMEAFPNKNIYELRQLILEASSQFSKPDSLKGYGIPYFNSIFDSKLQNENFIIFSNPCHGELNLIIKNNTSNSEYKTSIINSIGQRIYSTKTISNNIIIPNDISDGYYFLELSNSNFSEVKPFVLIR